MAWGSRRLQRCENRGVYIRVSSEEQDAQNQTIRNG